MTEQLLTVPDHGKLLTRVMPVRSLAGPGGCCVEAGRSTVPGDSGDGGRYWLEEVFDEEEPGQFRGCGPMEITGDVSSDSSSSVPCGHQRGPA
jgi:hypothetical protein